MGDIPFHLLQHAGLVEPPCLSRDQRTRSALLVERRVAPIVLRESDTSSHERRQVECRIELGGGKRRHSRRCRRRFAAKETDMQRALEQHRSMFAEGHDSPISIVSPGPFLFLMTSVDAREGHCTTTQGPCPGLAPRLRPFLLCPPGMQDSNRNIKSYRSSYHQSSKWWSSIAQRKQANWSMMWA